MAPQRRPRRFGLVIPRGGENWPVIPRVVGRFGRRSEAVEIRVGAPAAKAARRGLALTRVGEWPGRALGNRIGRALGMASDARWE